MVICLIQKMSQQLLESKKLPSQRQQKQSQVPSGSVVTPTTQYWPTSSATGKQIKSGRKENMMSLPVIASCSDIENQCLY